MTTYNEQQLNANSLRWAAVFLRIELSALEAKLQLFCDGNPHDVRIIKYDSSVPSAIIDTRADLKLLGQLIRLREIEADTPKRLSDSADPIEAARLEAYRHRTWREIVMRYEYSTERTPDDPSVVTRELQARLVQSHGHMMRCLAVLDPEALQKVLKDCVCHDEVEDKYFSLATIEDVAQWRADHCNQPEHPLRARGNELNGHEQPESEPSECWIGEWRTSDDGGREFRPLVGKLGAAFIPGVYLAPINQEGNILWNFEAKHSSLAEAIKVAGDFACQQADGCPSDETTSDTVHCRTKPRSLGLRM